MERGHGKGMSIFTKHLNESGENYFEHFYFTARMSWALFYTAVTLLIHGLLPFLLTKGASTRVKKISRIFEVRVEQIQRKNSGNVNYAEAI